MQPPRIAPLPPDEWDAETSEQLAKMLAGPDGRPLNIFATFARHPKLLKRWLVFASHVLSKSRLPARDRELLILRTGWNTRAAYEWGQHVAIARSCGLGDDEIMRVSSGPDAPGWDPFGAALVRAADELHVDGGLSDATWAELAGRYDDQQLLEVPFTVGQYHLVGFALNSCRVPIDAGVDGFPPHAAGVARIAGLTLEVTDLDRSTAAYGALLLQPPHPLGPGAARFALGPGTSLTLDVTHNVRPVELELALPDPGSARERAGAAGFATPAGEGLVLVDPDGNRVRLGPLMAAP